MATDVNAEYWEEYYKGMERPGPSRFAEWVRPRIDGKRTFDVGCGIGRDTVYLAETEFVRGFDPQAPNSSMFTRGDHTTVWSEGYGPDEDDTLYARWFFHAVPRTVVHDILQDWRGELFAESRVLPGPVDNSHWRDPLNVSEHRALLIRLGYGIKYFEVSDQFSPLPDHENPMQRNPLLLRVWAYRL